MPDVIAGIHGFRSGKTFPQRSRDLALERYRVVLQIKEMLEAREEVFRDGYCRDSCNMRKRCHEDFLLEPKNI